MSVNIIKAWKDADYRNSLSIEELALIPTNPSGLIELNDEDLMGVAGGKNKGKGSGGGSNKGSGGKGSGGGSNKGSGGKGSGGKGSGGNGGGGGGTICMCTCFWCK
jgi:mersacidin/lichenicidin family type 2 lantibiotic